MLNTNPKSNINKWISLRDSNVASSFVFARQSTIFENKLLFLHYLRLSIVVSDFRKIISLEFINIRSNYYANLRKESTHNICISASSSFVVITPRSLCRDKEAAPLSSSFDKTTKINSKLIKFGFSNALWIHNSSILVEINFYAFEHLFLALRTNTI